MKIGILGGTFDPIHNGHLFIAECARDAFALDNVLFIPTGNPPHKTETSESHKWHRFNMTAEAISSNKYFSVSDIEVSSEEICYTLNTIKKLKNEDELFFIIGKDTLIDLKNWYKIEELACLVTFIVVDRLVDEEVSINETIKEYKKMYNTKILSLNIPILEISSTEVRKRIAENRTCRYLLPDKVLKYIEDNRLYIN